MIFLDITNFNSNGCSDCSIVLNIPLNIDSNGHYILT